MRNFTSLDSLIDWLENNSDPHKAFFSYTTDETGEHGAIRANSDGLRRYALEMLKKSAEMDARHQQHPMCLAPHEWLVSESGYDLIRSVLPEYESRDAIIRSDLKNDMLPHYAPKTSQRKKWLGIF